MIQSQSILNWQKTFSNQKGSGHITGALSFSFLFIKPIGFGILIFSIFITWFLTPSFSASATPTNLYLQSLVHKSRERNLADHRYWHLLLHYRPNLFGGWTSEVDDPNFFLASDGKTNPQAELVRTIESFFSETLKGKSQQISQCAFIARFHWLKTELDLDTTKFPQSRCDKFEAWLSELNPQGISLIFPSAYLNNPASMFGHSFLRVDQKGQTEHTRILAYTINYAAEVTPGAGMEFAYKGIFGGYKGYFMSPPYYLKVKEYRDIENRDIWEYQLNFSEKQVLKLLRHVWELGDVYFDYFFFKENCAYHILSLLEIADPELHLTDQFILWTVPADTIKLISGQPGLVKETTYRPSHYTQIKRKREGVPSEQFEILYDLVFNASISPSETLERLEVKEKVYLLDLALDYLQYKRATDKESYKILQSQNRNLLLTRSALGIKSPIIPIPSFTGPPENGHRTSRASIGMGWRQDELFEEFNIRAGYHDWLDPDSGYTPDAQIKLASATFRHYEKRSQFRFENFTLADIASLAPIDHLFRTPSWKFKLGMETIRFKSCHLCSNGNLNAGVGASLETHLFKREVYFLFAEIDGNVSGAFDHLYRIGGGVTGGVLVNFTERWKALGSIGYLGYPLGDQSGDLRYSVGQRYTLSQNLSLRTEFFHRDQDNQVLGTFQAFF